MNDYTTRAGARVEQARVQGIAAADCPEADHHEDDGSGEVWCSAGACELSHFTECEECGEFTLFCVGDSAPYAHDDCERDEVSALRMARAEQARVEAQATADALDAVERLSAPPLPVTSEDVAAALEAISEAMFFIEGFTVSDLDEEAERAGRMAEALNRAAIVAERLAVNAGLKEQ